MVSRFLGLGRDMLMAAVFGAGSLASAFVTAFTLPNLFRRLLGEGALTAAFVPTLNEQLRERQKEGAFAVVNSVASWLFVVSGAVVVASMAGIMVAVAFADSAKGLGLTADSVRRWLEAADLAIILFPYLMCACMAAAFSAALQTLQRFVEPALSPIWLNVAMIGCLVGAAYAGWAASPEGRMLWLCGGVLIGGALQVSVPALALMREGWRPRFTLHVSDPLRDIVKLMVPTLFGSAIYLVNMSVSRVIGLSLNDSAVVLLNLATRLMELPIGVFAIAVSTVIFPLISKYAGEGKWDALAATYHKGLRLILVINVPAAAGLVALALPIVRLLFVRGEFTEADARMMQPVLIVSGLGLPFFAYVNIMLRAYYAQRDTKTPVVAAFISFVVNIALSVALMRPLGTMGLALASNLAVVVQAVYLQRALTRKRVELAFGPVVGNLVKITGAALAMGLAVMMGWRVWAEAMPPTKLYDGLGVVALIGGGAALYGAIVWMMRIEGRDDLALVLARVRGKFSRGK